MRRAGIRCLSTSGQGNLREWPGRDREAGEPRVPDDGGCSKHPLVRSGEQAVRATHGLVLKAEGRDSETVTGRWRGEALGPRPKGKHGLQTHRALLMDPRKTEQFLVNLKQGILGQLMYVPLKSRLLE